MIFLVNERVANPSLIEVLAPFPLHLLGWKAFQDLCVSVAEECLRRPVQSFLPNNDAGRDGAFVGRWDGDDPAAGESTIQCKFTSKQELNLSLSMLVDELEKARRLAGKGLADDYIILTNHPVTGESELAIKEAFVAVGVKTCRVFGADWITRQIRTSPRLRMMVPRLYGLGDLNDLLDGRAYAQAQLILSAMGNDLQRLVVTDAHRRSVRAISEHSLVLLLGSPAAGKSTIGASIAVGAADMWHSNTVRATSPEDVQRHLDPTGNQFFWIDDAWGNTQYQRGRIEAWNQVLPLMNGALRRNTRFLITSRDYIWAAAKKELKLSGLPVLNKSQVVIDVHELSTAEKAQILYNHIKMGDQSTAFKTALKPHLPALSERRDFLPETARRLGSHFFTGHMVPAEAVLRDFFAKPKDFLKETIAGLSAECRAAIATIFLNGGTVRSPVSDSDIDLGADAFGVKPAEVRESLDSLNGSLLLLAQDEAGSYWSYKHPTVSDAFASYVAENPELVELYLRGARPESIIYEVVCAGIKIQGAPVVVPDSLLELLLNRLWQIDGSQLRTFMSYRANATFNAAVVQKRSDALKGLEHFFSPIKADPDATLLAALHRQGILSEKLRRNFFEKVQTAVVEEADSSIFDDTALRAVLTADELEKIRRDIREKVLPSPSKYVESLRSSWDSDNPPDDHFDELESSFKTLAEEVCEDGVLELTPLTSLKRAIDHAIARMEDDYQGSSSTSAPVQHSTPQQTGLHGLFRDVDE